MRLLTGAAAVGLGLLGYSLVEARQYTLRRFSVPVLPPGAAPVRVLHLSDLHLTPHDTDRILWVRRLIRWKPDLVINTGDNLAHPRALPLALGAMAPFADLPGLFTLGSNDFHVPQLKNPLRYLGADARRAGPLPAPLPGAQLAAALQGWGWRDVANQRTSLEINGVRISVVGLGDAHLDQDHLPPPVAEHGDLHLGITHAPYLRVLQEFQDDGVQVAFAGHTHGGQVCLPGGRALTTNSDLDVGRARGLHGWPGGLPTSDARSMWLHVSAGLGTSPYTPIRFACRPEASLLTLVPVDRA